MTDLLRTACCSHPHWRDDCDNCREVTRLTREITDWRDAHDTLKAEHQTSEDEVCRLADILALAGPDDHETWRERAEAATADVARLTDEVDLWRRMATKLADDADGLLAVVEAAVAWQDAPRDNAGRIRDEAIVQRLLIALNDYRYPVAHARSAEGT